MTVIKMGRKIFTLLFLLIVLISISAVSAADLNGNNDTVALSDDGDALSIENDVDTINDLDEDASGDILSMNDDNSVVAGQNMEVYDAKYVENGEDSTILGYGYRPAELILALDVWEEYEPDRDFSLRGLVKDASGNKIEKGIVDLTFNGLGITFELDKDEGNIDYNFGVIDAGSYVVEAFYHDDSGEYLSDTYIEEFEIQKHETQIPIYSPGITMEVNDTAHFMAEPYPTEIRWNVTYSSSNPEVVEVAPDSNFRGGDLWAHSVGSAIITLSFPGSKNYEPATSEIRVNVGPKKIPTNIVINTRAIDMYINETKTIGAELIPKEAGKLCYDAPGNFISVSPDGTVKANTLGGGRVRVYLDPNEGYAPAEAKYVYVTVLDHRIPTHIDLKTREIELKVNEEFSINASLSPAGAGKLFYSSYNREYATIKNNKIVGVGEGTTEVVVGFDGNEKYAPSRALISVRVTPSNDTVTYKVQDYDDLARALEDAQKQTAPNCIINLVGDRLYFADKNIVLRESAGLKNIDINGNYRIIDGLGRHSFLRVIGFLTSLNGLKLTISDATFKNFNAQGNDGSVLSMIMGYGEANLNNVKFIDNAARNGGALDFAVLTDVNINGCQFIRNSAAADGGAVYVDSMNFNIKDTTFSQNSAKNKGGAVYESVKTTTIGNSKFLENTARLGGALYYASGTVTCTGSEFLKNVATEDAGAVYRNGPFYDYNNVFRDNSPNDFEYTGSAEGDDISPSSYSGYSGSGTGYRSIDKITVGNQISIIDNMLTLGVLNQIFDKDFRNGHLLVYIDGILVFNATTTDDLTQIIIDLLSLLLGKHEIKVVFTDNDGNTKTYSENITI